VLNVGYIFMSIDISMDMFGWSVAHLGWEKGEYKEETRHQVLWTDFVESIEACTVTDSPTTAGAALLLRRLEP
jgi:hypothetical protein